MPKETIGADGGESSRLDYHAEGLRYSSANRDVIRRPNILIFVYLLFTPSDAPYA